MDIKIIANYLPQYHQIAENDKWWGKGYTDWVCVKEAKNIVNGIKQPKVPLNDNYYRLDNPETIKWQAKIAKENGIYGFGIYHYWFSSKQCLLDKPVKLILENKDIDINYMFIWDNVSWKRSWDAVRFSNSWAPLKESSDKSGNGMLAELKYGNEVEWSLHFQYLINFMKDSRYIKVNNKPVFAVFNQDNESDILRKMFALWNKEAIKYGFDGIEIWGKINNRNITVADKQFYYEPHEHGWINHNIFQKIISKLNKKRPLLYSYSSIWQKILKEAEKCSDSKLIYGAFVAYDDSPRRGKNSRIVKGASPEAFEQYMSSLKEICRKQNKEFLFVTAWNEWGEGAYLEADKENDYKYLEALKNS